MNTSLKYDIVYKLLDVHKKSIVNVITNTGAIIPVKRSPMVNDKIEIKDETYYYNSNRVILNKVEYPDSRVLLINNYDFEKESYQRVRLLISKLFIKKSSIKDNIIKIRGTSEKTDSKRTKIKQILETMSKDSIYIDKDKINLDNYRTPIYRILCKKDKKCKSVHCKHVGSKCKLRIMSKNLVNGLNNIHIYLGQIADELIRNPFRGNEIIYDKVPTILDYKHIRPMQNEILLDSKEKLLDLDKYYFDKPVYHKNIYNNINYLQMRELDFNRRKYIKHQYKNITEYVDTELSSHWKKILREDYKIFKYRDFKENTITTVHNSLAYTIKYITNSKNMSNIQLNSLSNKLDCNILILESRITKDNRRGFVLHENKSNKYIIIYRYKINNNTIYSPVIIDHKVGIFNELHYKLKGHIISSKKNKIKIKKKD
jgi:hypothetical protein